MSSSIYLKKIKEVIKRIEKEQIVGIRKAAMLMANSIFKKRIVYLFGCGHSVIPCLDIFPRYGTFVGFEPITDLGLMWSSIIGTGGTKQVLWIERQEGYVKEILKSYNMTSDDSIIIFSHGGVNAAPVEMALLCKDKGMNIIGVTNGEYLKISKSSHSSGKRLGDIADIVIDNCSSAEDTLVDIKGLDFKVAAGSTVTDIIISMSLVSETAKLLTEKGIKLNIFVSPTDNNAEPNHNDEVYKKYMETVYKIR